MKSPKFKLGLYCVACSIDISLSGLLTCCTTFLFTSLSLGVISISKYVLSWIELNADNFFLRSIVIFDFLFALSLILEISLSIFDISF